jgi:hypothetical protein
MEVPVHVRVEMSLLSTPRVLPRSRRITRSVLKPVRVLGFWSAVALPFLHIPLLVTGLDGASETLAFLALFALNVVALVLGHSYGAE